MRRAAATGKMRIKKKKILQHASRFSTPIAAMAIKKIRKCTKSKQMWPQLVEDIKKIYNNCEKKELKYVEKFILFL